MSASWTWPRSPLVAGALALGLATAAAAPHGFPPAYGPVVVLPQGAPQRYEFDLSAALQRAQRERKRLYVYLGADDCPFCRKYELFLARNATALVPEFAKDYIVYDLRSSLSVQADRLWFRIGDKSLPYADFMRAIGDERVRQLVYPSVWLFDAQAKPLMQMPAGTGTFETVDEQLEILHLVQ
ncbi:MAG: thioredoxin family protein [Rubrivivax sp.]|nr:thioredoxin family protein [Rubrivivax sp.]MDH5341129.1 thioredoxin family protein [Rubrivivax sp.]